jgi:hypothetical protein
VIERASKSTAPTSTASSTDNDRPSRTMSTATSALRPRRSAMASAKAAASFTTLSLTSAPSSETGVDAPIAVPGAMAATCADNAMSAPAEPARAPWGLTYATTGTSAARNPWTMSRIDSSSPPGVSISTTSAP